MALLGLQVRLVSQVQQERQVLLDLLVPLALLVKQEPQVQQVRLGLLALLALLELLVIRVILVILDQPVMMDPSVTTFSTVEILQQVMKMVPPLIVAVQESPVTRAPAANTTVQTLSYNSAMDLRRNGTL
jgi:hypothetical protein